MVCLDFDTKDYVDIKVGTQATISNAIQPFSISTGRSGDFKTPPQGHPAHFNIPYTSYSLGVLLNSNILLDCSWWLTPEAQNININPFFKLHRLTRANYDPLSSQAKLANKLLPIITELIEPRPWNFQQFLQKIPKLPGVSAEICSPISTSFPRLANCEWRERALPKSHLPGGRYRGPVGRCAGA